MPTFPHSSQKGTVPGWYHLMNFQKKTMCWGRSVLLRVLKFYSLHIFLLTWWTLFFGATRCTKGATGWRRIHLQRCPWSNKQHILRAWELSHAQGLQHIQLYIQWSSQVVLALLSVSHQSLLCTVNAVMRGALYGLLLTTSRWEHKQAQGTRQGKSVPMICVKNLWLLFFFVPMCLAVWHFIFVPCFSLFPDHPKWFTQPVFYFYHHKVGKAQWSKTGNGNFPGKGWRGTKRRKHAWIERLFTGDGHTALGIYPHL